MNYYPCACYVLFLIFCLDSGTESINAHALPISGNHVALYMRGRFRFAFRTKFMNINIKLQLVAKNRAFVLAILDLECVLFHVTGVQNEKKCPYKSAILDFSEDRWIQKVMGRV